MNADGAEAAIPETRVYPRIVSPNNNTPKQHFRVYTVTPCGRYALDDR